MTVIWSIGKILYAVPAAIIGYLMNVAMFEAMQEAAGSSPAPMPAGFFGVLQKLGAAGAVLGLLWFWALPVFLLVWFSRSRIRDEVAGWDAQAPE